MLLTLALCLSMIPTASAAQQNSYHDPVEHWQQASNRTNELDVNSIVTHETFYCATCRENTDFTVWRVPEYTRSGETALNRNVKYSNGMCIDEVTVGSLDAGVPGENAYYTGYHWTKSVCSRCGDWNSTTAWQTDSPILSASRTCLKPVSARPSATAIPQIVAP